MTRMNRRSFLGAAGAAAAAAGVSTVLPGNAVAQPVLNSGGSTGLQIIGSPGLVGVRAAQHSSGPLGEVRFAIPTGWSQWMPLQAEPHGRQPGDSPVSAPVPTPDDAVGFEVRAPEGSEPVYAGSGSSEAPAGSNEVTGVGEIGGAEQYAALPVVDCYGIPVVPRWAWGADELISFGNIEYRPAQLITVHHSVTPASWDPASTMRGFHRYHAIVNGWGDIGYQLVVDPSGQVYQGHRTHSGYPVFGGPMPPGVRPDSVVGAHVGGNNSGNIGVCLMGNFSEGYPNIAAYSALVNVLAKLCNALSLDPFQGVGYWNPDGGYGSAKQAINGHRDWMSTGCPGDWLYNTLPQVRQAVAYARSTGTMFPTSAGAPPIALPGSTG